MSKASALATINSWTAPVIAPNAPGIVPQVYYGSTGTGSNQNANTTAKGTGGYTAPVTAKSGTIVPQLQTGYSSGGTSSGNYSSNNASSTQSYYAPPPPVTTTVKADDLGAGTSAYNVGGIGATGSLGGSPGTAVAGNIATGADPNTGLYNTSGVDAKGNPIKTGVTTPQEPTTLSEYLKTKLGEAPVTDYAQIQREAEQANNLYAIQQQKNNTQNSINAITTKMNVDLQGQRQMASDNGGTDFAFGGRQAEIAREATIRLLPLQAQLAVDQGNLELATQHVDTMVKMAIETATQKSDNWWKQASIVEQDWTASEKKKIDAIKQTHDDATTRLIDNINYLQSISLEAMKNGDRTTFNGINGVISKMNTLDTTSSTFATDMQKIMSGASQYGGFGTAGTKAPEVKSINGVDMQWNTKTGKWETITTNISSPGELSLAKAKANIDNITSLTTGGSSAIGTSFLTRAPSGFWGTVGKIASVVGIPSLVGDIYNKMTGKQQEFISSTEQLRSQLSLDSLINAKKQGATFGALSDTEMRILSSSASKLGTWAINDGNGNIVGYNTTEDNFRKEMDKINNFAKLDYLLKGGKAEDINVKLMPDGHYVSQNSDGTFTQIY